MDAPGNWSANYRIDGLEANDRANFSRWLLLMVSTNTVMEFIL